MSRVGTPRRGERSGLALERTIASFAAHGIARIERLIIDHAWAYRYSLRAVCAAHGVRQKFLRRHCPWQNGMVERFNRTLATEWADQRAYDTNEERRDALAPRLQHYNTRRLHPALGGQPLISRLTPTS